MMMVLLASCDPCRHVADDASPVAYLPLAVAMAERLGTTGCHSVDLYLQFPDEAEAAPALQACEAAVDWWTRDRTAVSRSSLGFT